MKQSIKFGIIAFALAAVSSAYAADAETESEYEAIGWTPVEIGLASPVQLPWGCHQWDIFGLGLNVIWNDAPKMYGLGIGGIAMATRNDMCGLQIGGLCNWATEDVYGLRLTIGGNITFGTTYGSDIGLFAYRDGDMWGFDAEFIGSYQKRFWGVQIGGLATAGIKRAPSPDRRPRGSVMVKNMSVNEKRRYWRWSKYRAAQRSAGVEPVSWAAWAGTDGAGS